MKGAPEVQLHASISIVRAGDPYGISQEDRKDDISEVTQLAAQFPRGAMGNLRKDDIMQAMVEITHGFIEKARAAGILKQGE